MLTKVCQSRSYRLLQLFVPARLHAQVEVEAATDTYLNHSFNLTQFESKSNRVKGIAFHPRQPLLAASLHNGNVQLWNYQMGTLVGRLDEHDGELHGLLHSTVCTDAAQTRGGIPYVEVHAYRVVLCLFHRPCSRRSFPSIQRLARDWR